MKESTKETNERFLRSARRSAFLRKWWPLILYIAGVAIVGAAALWWWIARLVEAGRL